MPEDILVCKESYKYINLVFDIVLKKLYEYAQKSDNNRLPIPVHMILDDFACSARIEGFSNFISLIRSSGISASILLQSVTQLKKMYDEAQAATILNNCDRIMYLGGMDVENCEYISKYLNIPSQDIFILENEYMYLICRGEKPEKVKRYLTFEDEVYKEYFIKNETKELE